MVFSVLLLVKPSLNSLKNEINMYSILDDGASLMFQFGAITKRIIKHKVCGIQVLDDDIIKIDLGNTLQNFYFRKSMVTVPAAADVNQLCTIINSMITDCVCCGCDTIVIPN